MNKKQIRIKKELIITKTKQKRYYYIASNSNILMASILQPKVRDWQVRLKTETKKQDPSFYCLHDIYLTDKDMLKVKGWKKDFQYKWSPKASRSSYTKQSRH
jgi:hypothetical protein